eukprot:5490601-Lingulodinium_polyedra.AAC.1
MGLTWAFPSCPSAGCWGQLQRLLHAAFPARSGGARPTHGRRRPRELVPRQQWRLSARRAAQHWRAR